MAGAGENTTKLRCHEEVVGTVYTTCGWMDAKKKQKIFESYQYAKIREAFHPHPAKAYMCTFV